MKVSFYCGILCIAYCITFPIPALLIPLFIILFVILRDLWSDSIDYHRMTKTAPILESVYTGNIAAFSRFLSNRISIRTLLSLYFIFTLCLSTYATYLDQGGMGNITVFAFFVILAVRSIRINIKLFRAKIQLHSNPTVEQCLDIAQTVLDLDYASHYENRLASSYSELFTRTPSYYKTYLIFSAFGAIFTIILGVLTFWILIDDEYTTELNRELAVLILIFCVPLFYHGITDFISCITTPRPSPANQQ